MKIHKTEIVESGIIAHVKGKGFMNENVTIRYSDEDSDRIGYQYENYLNIKEIRLSSSRNVLFIRVGDDSLKIIEYDLINKTGYQAVRVFN